MYINFIWFFISWVGCGWVCCEAVLSDSDVVRPMETEIPVGGGREVWPAPGVYTEPPVQHGQLWCLCLSLLSGKLVTLQVVLLKLSDVHVYMHPWIRRISISIQKTSILLIFLLTLTSKSCLYSFLPSSRMYLAWGKFKIFSVKTLKRCPSKGTTHKYIYFSLFYVLRTVFCILY